MDVRIVDAESVIEIGIQGEDHARVFSWDISCWVEEYGEGTVQLLVQRDGDPAPYPVEITKAGTIVYWSPSSADTQRAGYGMAQLSYYVESVIAKQLIMTTLVKPSLGESVEPPEPYQGWVDEVLQAGAAAIQSASDAKESEDNAKISADAAQAAANSMSFVSFEITENGELVVNRAERLGTTAFSLNDNGELEVTI